MSEAEPIGGVLSGLRVLDVGQGVSAPFCTRLLADYGADVIKVEPPEGDLARRTGPFVGDEPHLEKSIPFLFLNTNKRGVTLNLRAETGRGLLHKLAGWADVLVENTEPRQAGDLGLDYETLRQANPRLVVTSISNFGQTGPYRDWKATDLISCALSSHMYLSGDADKEPLRNALSQSLYVAGINASAATMVAIYHRLATGEGQHVDVSVMESMACHLVQATATYAFMGGVRRRRPHKGVPFEEIMPCQDGYIVPSAQTQTFETIADLLGLEELKDPRFATPEGRIINGVALEELVLKALAHWKRYDIFHEANNRRLVFGVIQGPEDFYRCPHLRARDYFVKVRHPVAGEAEYPGELVHMTEGSYQMRCPAPLLGEHNGEVYGRVLGLCHEKLSRFRGLSII